MIRTRTIHDGVCRTPAAAALVLAAGLLWALAGAVAAQGSFRVSYDLDRSRQGQTRVVGQVTNDSVTEVYDVHVTAEALDRGGKVVASGIAFVASRIDRGQSRSFSATVPVGAEVTRFRVGVTSFRPGLGLQAP